MSKYSSDQQDNDDTDELPVLLEEVAFAPETERLLGAPRAEDTSEQTALHAAVVEDDSPQLHAELTLRAARIARLEAESRTHLDRTRELEQRLAQRDEHVQELKRTLDALRLSLEETASSERQLATELANREASVAEQAAAVERLRADVAERSAKIEMLRAAHETTRREADALKRELAARDSANSASIEQELREENAALAAYIAGRRVFWEEAQATQTQLGARVAALEHELSARQQRLAAAEAFATQETDRATALRSNLIAATRRAAALERELREARAASALAPPLVVDTASPTAAAPTDTVTTADSLPAAPAAATAAKPTTSAAPPPNDVSQPAPATEAIAQLEAEVEYKRQQVAAQLVELRERDQRLRAVTSDLERLRRDFTAARAELEESRLNVARLEKAIIDKDRALDARDARISTLHDELKQHLGIIEKLNSIDFSLSKLEPAAAKRDAPSESQAMPALICLTGDAAKRFPLTKRTVTLGRGPQCDLQIVTHYVSREHARITLIDGKPLIEDLGSRNGVFVNSVRVDRRALQHGDLITIGESQFRFVESMAH